MRARWFGAPAEMKTIFVGEPHRQINLVAVLVFGDVQVRRAVFVSLGDHASGNGVARPAGDFDSGVIGVDAKRGFRADRVGLRPVLGKSRQGQQRETES